jgi:hypothetical protein
VLLLATAMVVVARLALDGQALPMLVLSLVVWLPAWLMAINLARTRQQALPLLMVAMLVAAYAIAVRLAVGDMAAFWSQRLQPLFDLVARDSGTQFSAEQIALVAGQVHTWSLVAMFSMLVATVLVARWWQAALFNPGGFGTEFRELCLPRVALFFAALVSAAVTLLALSGSELRLAGDAFVIVVILFAFQGLAVIHSRARLVALASGWMTGMYVLLVLTPQIVGPILAAAGVADSLADFRHLKTRVEAPDKSDSDND